MLMKLPLAQTLRRADAKLARRLEDFLGRISGEVRSRVLFFFRAVF